ncbi:hypothetical protein F5B19DRAFT_468960 [Rostrohypoxylon terebratum]|nr:hypothetical protein F5B19DRAFT_468960 [Rostrohypoxylon terebratum]
MLRPFWGKTCLDLGVCLSRRLLLVWGQHFNSLQTSYCKAGYAVSSHYCGTAILPRRMGVYLGIVPVPGQGSYSESQDLGLLQSWGDNAG